MDNICSFLDFFSKYDVPCGLSACDSFLSASAVLSTSTLPKWIALADAHTLPHFLTQCQSYAANHMAVLIAASGAKQWMAQLAPTTLTGLLMQSLARCNDLHCKELEDLSAKSKVSKLTFNTTQER